MTNTNLTKNQPGSFDEQISAVCKPVRRVVIKIGSSSLITKEGTADQSYIIDLMRQVAELRRQEIEVILVSSGAIAVGMSALGITTRPQSMEELQACAAVGQAALMEQYQRAAQTFGLAVGQILITRRDTYDKQSVSNARATFKSLLSYGVVPIVNENDTVSVEEIRFGDNDTLSALVTALTQADMAIILSDVDGLYTANPTEDSSATLISVVNCITLEMLDGAGGSGSGVGTGGMRTKLRAARLLVALQKMMVVANAHTSNVILRVVGGDQIGTRFVPDQTHKVPAHEKLWLTLQSGSHGAIIIDDGAVYALQHTGASLLPCGVVGTRGSFNACDVVDIEDMQGRLIGVGMTSYDKYDINVIAGRSLDEVEEILQIDSHRCRPAVYRDYLWVF